MVKERYRQHTGLHKWFLAGTVLFVLAVGGLTVWDLQYINLETSAADPLNHCVTVEQLVVGHAGLLVVMIVSGIWAYLRIRRDLNARIQAEARYRQLSELTFEGILLHDNGVALDINTSFTRLTGYSPEELVGKSVIEMIALPKYHRLVAENMRSPDAGPYEVEIVRKDGAVIPVEVQAKAVEHPDQPFGVAALRDISRRKEREARFRESDDFNRNLTENANVMIIGLAREGVVTLFNRAAEAVTGYRADEIEGKSWFETVVPKSRFPYVFDEHNRLVGGGKPRRFENPILTRSGEERYISWSITKLFSGGAVVGTMSFGQDITELRHALEKLEESEERYRRLADASFEAIGLSKQGRIVDVSKQIESIYGYTQEEFKRVGLEKLVHPDDLALVMHNIRNRVPGPYQHRGIAKDGSVLHLEIRAEVISIKGEEHRLTVIRDISHTKRMHEQLRQAEKTRALGQLAGGIAHDFNNVLAAITGYAEMSLDCARGNPHLVKYIEQILAASDRSKNLVKQILTFARQRHQEMQVLHLQPLIGELLELLGAVIPSSIEVTTEFDIGIRPVLGDAGQIHEVLMNLVTNAVYAMDEKGTLRFRVFDARHREEVEGDGGTIASGHYTVIEVADTGCGMNDEIKQRIFDPFFTTKPVGKGTGMGLSVVLGIVEAHGGNIQVESAVDRGTTVRVFLPVTKQQRAEVMSEPPRDISGAERVLFVDDEELIVEMASALLPSLGYQVTATTSPDEALLCLTDKPDEFDLLITDQTMPRLTGVELAKAALAIKPSLPIILCTGYSNRVSLETASGVGIAKLCMKPLRRRALGEAIREVLDNSRS